MVKNLFSQLHIYIQQASEQEDNIRIVYGFIYGENTSLKK